MGAKDGILHESLNLERHIFENLNGKDLPVDHWLHHGSLAWDSMVIKEKVFFCPNTLRIVGFAEDAFDLNIIKKELEQRINSTANIKNDKEQISGVVSRYGVASLDSTFIADKIFAGFSALAQYGYIVDTIACDGASENRSALKTLATIKAKDFLASKISNIDGGDNIMKKSPWIRILLFGSDW